MITIIGAVNDYLHQYINNYCAESLIRFAFAQMPNIAIDDQFQNVFANVQSLAIDNCIFGKQLPTFVKCFPNLRRFEANNTEVHERFSKQTFQQLQHLRIEQYSRGASIQFVADLLHGSHRLRSFCMTNYADSIESLSMLLDLIKSNTLITTLYWENSLFVPVTSSDVQRIVAEHSALIELDLKCFRFAADDVVTLTRQLSSLKQFSFWMRKTEYKDLIAQLDDEWKFTCQLNMTFLSSIITLQR